MLRNYDGVTRRGIYGLLAGVRAEGRGGLPPAFSGHESLEADFIALQGASRKRMPSEQMQHIHKRD
ncbi:hypothetical protein BH20ACT13_BH20ACT13_06050 [soil metagenome]